MDLSDEEEVEAVDVQVGHQGLNDDDGVGATSADDDGDYGDDEDDDNLVVSPPNNRMLGGLASPGTSNSTRATRGGRRRRTLRYNSHIDEINRSFQDMHTSQGGPTPGNSPITPVQRRPLRRHVKSLGSPHQLY